MDYEEGRKRLEDERAWVQQGNPKLLERHGARGRHHVSERIRLLVDEGSWFEYGEFARSLEPGFKERSPRDGVMTGLGRINGQAVAIIGDDITVLGGTQSFVSVRKVDRIIDIATKNGFPIISLSEGGGVRVPDGIGAGFTRLCGLHQVKSLSWLANPQRRPLFICGVFGYTYGDPAFRAGMADVTVMVEDSSVAVSGPSVIEAAISEEIGDSELGGPQLHQVLTGTVDAVAKTEEKAISLIRRVFHIMRPSEPAKDPTNRLVPDLEAIVPHNNRRVYDMKKVIERLCDGGEWLELKSRYGTGLLVGLARIGGRLIGVLASQPLSAGGSVDAKGLRKSAAFMEFAIRRRIPLLVIHDIPGFLIGSAVEKDGMVNAIANHARVLDSVDVPMVSLVIRKAYGAAYYFLGMGASGAGFVAAWPNAEISFMAPHIGAAVLCKHVDAVNKKEAIKLKTAELERSASIWDSAHEFWLDAVIAPSETRKVICEAFDYLVAKKS